jgi:hypothetical protein
MQAPRQDRGEGGSAPVHGDALEDNVRPPWRARGFLCTGAGLSTQARASTRADARAGARNGDEAGCDLARGDDCSGAAGAARVSGMSCSGAVLALVAASMGAGVPGSGAICGNGAWPLHSTCGYASGTRSPQLSGRSNS